MAYDGMQGEFYIEGWEELRKALRELEPKYCKEALRKALRAGQKVVLKSARDRAPVAKELSDWAKEQGLKPGDLKRSIKIRTGKRGKRERDSIKLEVGVGLGKGAADGYINGKWYWAFVEYGTSRMKARPYLRVAFDTNVEAVGKATVDAAWEAIKKRWGEK